MLIRNYPGLNHRVIDEMYLWEVGDLMGLNEVDPEGDLPGMVAITPEEHERRSRQVLKDRVRAAEAKARSTGL